MLAVIDTAIKSQGDASTDSKSRNFRRKFGDAFSAFQKTRSTLSKDFFFLDNTWRPSSQLHIFSRQAQSSATLSLLFRKRVQLCQKEPHPHYYVSFRRQRGVVQKSKGRLLRNRRGVVQISKRHLSTRVKEQYHHLILSLYMSTFVFYGKANLKKMPNSPSPLRAHSQ